MFEGLLLQNLAVRPVMLFACRRFERTRISPPERNAPSPRHGAGVGTHQPRSFSRLPLTAGPLGGTC